MKICSKKVINLQRNTNQNHHEMLLHNHQNGYNKKGIQKFGMCVEKLEPSYIADGKVKWYSHFDEQLAVPQKVRHCVCTQDLAITLLGTYPRNMKNVCPNKNLHQNAHESLVYHSPVLEITQMSISFDEWIEWYIYGMQYYMTIKNFNYPCILQHG